MDKSGVEVTLNTPPIVGQFEWDSELQVSVNKNKLKSLSGTTSAAIIGYGQWSDVVSLSEVGSSLYNFYGYVTDGVYKDFADIQNSPKTSAYPFVKDGDGNIVRDAEGNVQLADAGKFNRGNTVWVGDVKYKDLNGDGIIDENDRTNIGSPMPDFTFGWTNTFRYKNFDLSVFINGSVGNKVMNYMSINLTHMNSAWTNQLAKVNGHAVIVPIDADKAAAAGAKSWYYDITNSQVANPNAVLPRVTLNDPNDNDRISDRYVEDGSYVRLKNITFGYTFPKNVSSG